MNAATKIGAPRPPRGKPADRMRLMAGEKPAGSRLPYAHHVNDTTLRLRGGELMCVMRLDGFPFETADAAELDYRCHVRATMLRSIASSRFAVYQHAVRRRVHPYPDGAFADPFCRALNAAWKRRVSEGALFVNDLYLTLIRRPLQGKVGWVDQAMRLVRRRVDAEAARVRDEKDRRELDAAVDSLLGVLQPYGARLLSVYDTPSGPASEPLEFLSCLYNDELRPVLLPRADLGHHLPYKRVSFGDEAFELRGATADRDRVGAIVSVKDYPCQTHAGMMDALLRLPHELVVTQSFAYLDRQVTVDRMKLNLRRLRTASDDETRSLRADTEAALDDVTYGRSAYGEHHMTVQMKAPTLPQLDDAVSDAIAAFTDLGVIAVREDLNLEPAFWAQFPGNLHDVARRSGISTANFASFASLHNFPVGKPHGNHWGPAVTMLETTSGTPYFLNFHKGDVGNFTLIGATGFGKTVLATFLVAQAQKFSPRTIYFDKDRGAEIFVRAICGSYAVIRPGQPTGFNPLGLPDSDENRAFLRRWVGKLVMKPGEPLSAEELADVADAVDANFDQALAYRNLAHFAELFRGKRRAEAGDIAARLSKWHSGGSHAWAFDNDSDTLDLDSATLGFDMTHLLDDPELRTPVMMYLFHRVEQRLDGTPTIIVVDEGWKALDDEAFEARIKDWEKTIRKRNGLVGFITQSAGDALASRVGSAIVEQSPTQFFLPNPKARAEEYCAGFGLSAYELEIVRELPDTSRCFLVRQGKDAVIARLDLTGYGEILAVLSGRETSVRALDELRGRHGDEPRAWLPPFISHLRQEGIFA